MTKERAQMIIAAARAWSAGASAAGREGRRQGAQAERSAEHGAAPAEAGRGGRAHAQQAA